MGASTWNTPCLLFNRLSTSFLLYAPTLLAVITTSPVCPFTELTAPPLPPLPVVNPILANSSRIVSLVTLVPPI